MDRLARPGRNATGTGALGPEQTVKTMDILKEAVPKASRIAMFFNDAFPLLVAMRPEIESTARRLRVTLTPIQVRGPEDLDETFGR